MRRARYLIAGAASACGSAILGAAASMVLKAAPGEIYGMRHQAVAILPLVALVGGLFMRALCSNVKAREVGRMLSFASALAIALAIAPR